MFRKCQLINVAIVYAATT